jgi:hypothetical protein
MLCGVFGLALAGCIALPFDVDSGRSILDVLLEAFGRDWFDGLVLSLLLAPPYAIGLCVGLATFTGGRFGATLVKVPLVLLHLEAVMLALVLVHSDERQRAWSLLGFSIVMAVRLIARAARSRSTGTHASLGWLARTGGLLVAGLYGWFRLQVEGSDIGIAIAATIVTAALMAATARTR